MCAVGRPRQAPVAEWYTRQVEGLCPKGRGGSSPLGGTRHTGHVRMCRNEAVATATGSVAVARFCARAASSVGRASRLHREGQGFESLAAHHLFSLPLPLFPNSSPPLLACPSLSMRGAHHDGRSLSASDGGLYNAAA